MKEDVGTTPVYSMGVAERLTGLTGRQIRYWEQNGLITPARTQGKQRVYSEADVMRLKEIKRMLGEGLSLDRVRAYYANREVRRLTAQSGSHMHDRIPRGGSLYTGGSRAEVERFIDRKLGK